MDLVKVKLTGFSTKWYAVIWNVYEDDWITNVIFTHVLSAGINNVANLKKFPISKWCFPTFTPTRVFVALNTPNTSQLRE